VPAGSIAKRATRGRPRFYAQFKDLDGRYKTPQQGPEAAVGPLLERWRDGVANRDADDDRSKVTRYALPTFQGMTMAEAQRLPAVMRWLLTTSKRPRSSPARRVGTEVQPRGR
jgi:hypothetical protein